MKKALLIVYSNFKKDNRIRKHKYFLKKAGYDVDIIGFSEENYYNPTIVDKIKYLFWFVLKKEKAIKYLFGKLEYKSKLQNKYDLIIANDWEALPIAVNFLSNNNILVYDSHEYAIKMATQNFKWWLFIRPLAKYIEEKYIKYADMITCVSKEIVEVYKQIYKRNDVYLVRNISMYSDKNKLRIQKTKSMPIRMYYHGNYLKSRKLDTVLDVIKKFDKKYEVHLRLLRDTSSLKQKYASNKNIIFHKPIKPEKLLDDINDYDFGIAAQPAVNESRMFSLPNKFFDFIFGGVPVLICGETISMSRIVQKYDIGFIAKNFTQEAIEKVLKKISIEEINRKKKNLLKAQKELSAKKEWHRLIRKIEKLSKSV